MACEFDWDTYCCFSFNAIFNSSAYVSRDQDFPEQEAHATSASDGALLTNNINDNEGMGGYFNQLSQDDMLSVSIYLNPTEFRKLSITCSGLLNLINNFMWKQYNAIHNYHAWDLSLSSMRISYACFYYKTGKFDIAAKLDHPEALHEIRKREEAITLNSYDSYYGGYLDHKNDYYGCFY